jgi:hypothetical protein
VGIGVPARASFSIRECGVLRAARPHRDVGDLDRHEVGSTPSSRPISFASSNHVVTPLLTQW